MPHSELTSLHNSTRELLWAQSNHQSSNAHEDLAAAASQGTGEQPGVAVLPIHIGLALDT